MWQETEGSLQNEPFVQGPEGSQQGTQTLSWQSTGTESCQPTRELGSGSLPTRGIDEFPAPVLADTLITAL